LWCSGCCYFFNPPYGVPSPPPGHNPAGPGALHGISTPPSQHQLIDSKNADFHCYSRRAAFLPTSRGCLTFDIFLTPETGAVSTPLSLLFAPGYKVTRCAAWSVLCRDPPRSPILSPLVTFRGPLSARSQNLAQEAPPSSFT